MTVHVSYTDIIEGVTNDITSHITSHHIKSHDNTLHHTTSQLITSYHVTTHHITTHHIMSHHMSSYHITTHHITTHLIITYHNTSHHVAYVHYRCRWCVREHHHRAAETLHQHAYLHGGVLGHPEHGANRYASMKHYFHLTIRLTHIGFCC